MRLIIARNIPFVKNESYFRAVFSVNVNLPICDYKAISKVRTKVKQLF